MACHRYMTTTYLTVYVYLLIWVHNFKNHSLTFNCVCLPLELLVVITTFVSCFLFVPQFTGYDVGNNLIQVSGITSTLFPSDGGQIRVERTEHVQGGFLFFTSTFVTRAVNRRGF